VQLTPAFFSITVKRKTTITQAMVTAAGTVEAHMLTAAIVHCTLI